MDGDRAARFAFLPAARETVASADITVEDAVTEGSILDRAVERVLTAIESGTVGAPVSTPRVELFSYPVARLLVSACNSPRLLDVYAEAEARTACDRIVFDEENDPTVGLASVTTRAMTADELLAKLGYADAITEQQSGSRQSGGSEYTVEVGSYLELAPTGQDSAWKLVNRRLHDGVVPVSEREYRELVEHAVSDAVRDGLPVEVPSTVAADIHTAVGSIRDEIGGLPTVSGDFAMQEDAFPPVITELVQAARHGQLSPQHGFVLVAFFSAIGASPEELIDVVTDTGDEVPDDVCEQLRTQAQAVIGEGERGYAVPRTETLAEMLRGAVNVDVEAESSPHPVVDYQNAVGDES